jgi:hypothetical protein
MKLTWPRVTVRRMMVAVAVLAVAMGGIALRRRSEFYQASARHHSRMERSSVIAIVEGSGPASRDELARLNRARTAYHADLRQKYERAAGHPWVSMPPDPPEPVPLSGPGRRVDLNFHD